MKKLYFGLWSILFVAVVIFATLSFGSEQLEAYGIKTGTFAASLFGSEQKKEVPLGKGKVPMAKRNRVKRHVTHQKSTIDTTKQSILFIGDSMLEGLSPRLAAYSEKNGHTQNTVIWYSSTSEIWGSSGKLAGYIRKFKPTYIFICLGSNELFVSNIIEKRTRFVENLVKEIGNIPYVWIGPPNWKDDTGVNQMIQNVVPEGNYYLSYTPNQHYDRSKDGAHPTRASAAKWMDRVCKWVMTDSNHPIVLKMPDKTKAYCHTEVLQPKR